MGHIPINTIKHAINMAQRGPKSRPKRLLKIAVVKDTTIPNVISTPSGVGPLESPMLDHTNIAEFSDTSPVCETFKQVKRIDELDYLPLSKKKLKKLRKQEHATKSANSSSIMDTISPYIVGID